jgi:Rieske 2Fe-2S family protein
VRVPVVTRDAVERALRPLGEATMLPAVAYTSPEVLAWERQHFFDAGWVVAGRVADLTETGAQRAIKGALLVRDADGAVRAFANVCRHRGHELLAAGESACRPAIRCPYHGWTYALDGSLRHATGTDGGPEPDPASHGLAELRTTTWHGWILGNARGDADAFDAGPVEPVLAAHEPEHLVPVARHAYEVAANWKVLHENYQECVHCPMIHPQLCRVSPPDSGVNLAPGARWVGGWMDLATDAETMSTTGRLVGMHPPGLVAANRRRVGYFALVPSMLLSVHPDYVLTHRIAPLAPDRTAVECEWLFAPKAVSSAGFDPSPAVEFWDLTNRQDWAACESVQRGLSSPAYRPGPILAREDAVHHFVGLVARAYLEGS